MRILHRPTDIKATRPKPNNGLEQPRAADSVPFHLLDTMPFTLIIAVIATVLWPVTPTLLASQPDRSASTRLAELAANQTVFALDLYARLKEEGKNILVSPASITTALAMTTAGARGTTATQLRQALRLSLPQDDVHLAHAELAVRVVSGGQDDKTHLRIANALWPHTQHPFRDDYLNVLKRYYRATALPVDFEAAPEAARQTINNWVEKHTEGKISDLLPAGSVNTMTRMVLVNAVWFKGAWQHPFDSARTQTTDFSVALNRRVPVRMMRQTAMFKYASKGGIQLVEIPYADSDLAMLIILPPPKASLDQFDVMLTAEALQAWVQAMRLSDVDIQLPQFSMAWGSTSLKTALRDMGAVDAFEPGTADFSGMDGTRSLHIDDVVHKTFIDVTEEGTEAAATTGVGMRTVSLPMKPIIVQVDRPFYFLIHDRRTKTPLFFGRLVNPQG